MAAPHVVIVGGGFAGLVAARKLARGPVRITLIDRRNHHVFQPLLYQVATAALSPAQIAAPIRKVLSRYPNVEVLLGDVERVDALDRRVVLRDGAKITYDYLILAPGATHSYFGHDAWAASAPGLKSIEDALTIRRRFLLAFEQAERQRVEGAASSLSGGADGSAPTSPPTRAGPAETAAGGEVGRTQGGTLTFVIVGGGPTGVELAGAMVEIARSTIPKDFRSIDTASSRVILVEAVDRLLGAFPPDLSERARRDLVALGVEVRLNCLVTDIDSGGVTVRQDGRTERISAANVVWAAGVLASPLGASLGAPLDKAGRVMVAPDLSAPEHPEVFVVGDLAHVEDPRTHALVPGVAPAAMQMGQHAARIILDAVRGRSDRPAFRYFDKGLLATIGRAKAVAAFGKLHVAGFIAWLIWALVHIVYLINFRTKLSVMLEWAWYWVFFERGARLITGEALPPAQGGVSGMTGGAKSAEV
jgi:NADH dehydrogenase